MKKLSYLLMTAISLDLEGLDDARDVCLVSLLFTVYSPFLQGQCQYILKQLIILFQLTPEH